MNAMQAITRDACYFEALRYCDRHEITDPESFARIEHSIRFRAFEEAIQPFIQMKCGLFNFKMPKRILHTDGRSETIVEWTDDEKKTLAQIDDLIAAEAKRLGLPDQVGDRHE